MSLPVNIFLWTISLSLAFIGLTFGIIASINARKANKQIQGLISDTWIVQEIESFFFDKIKLLLSSNQRLIQKLNSKKGEISFFEYSILASPTRLAPLSKFTFNALKNSHYKQLAINYLNYKASLDEEFLKCFSSLENLKSRNPMDNEQKQKMVIYHQNVVGKLKQIMKEYSAIHVVWNNYLVKKPSDKKTNWKKTKRALSNCL